MRWLLVLALLLALQRSAAGQPQTASWERKVGIGQSVTLRDATDG